MALAVALKIPPSLYGESEECCRRGPLVKGCCQDETSASGIEVPIQYAMVGESTMVRSDLSMVLRC